MNLDTLKNILYIFPIMGYYLLESMLIAIPVYFVWRLILSPTFDIYFSYLQWIAMIWIIKIIFFDIFKLIAGFANINIENKNKEEDKEE
jgi:hypothetical protein